MIFGLRARRSATTAPQARPAAPPPDALPLATGVPALEEFPWRDWARISGRVFRERPAAALAYGDPQGLPELRSAIASATS